MTSALTQPTLTIADLLADVTNKDARHRVGTFIGWMQDTGGAWFALGPGGLPGLPAHRDQTRLDAESCDDRW